MAPGEIIARETKMASAIENGSLRHLWTSYIILELGYLCKDVYIATILEEREFFSLSLSVGQKSIIYLLTRIMKVSGQRLNKFASSYL